MLRNFALCNCKRLEFSFFSMESYHSALLWCVTVYLPTLQASRYELAHSVTSKKSWYKTFDFLRLCNGHGICQFSWQSEGFATQKHDGSSNSYSCIAEKVVVWVLSHTETFIALHWIDAVCQTWCVAPLCHIMYYITRAQNSFSDTVFCILLRWPPSPPFSIFSFQEGTYMEHN